MINEKDFQKLLEEFSFRLKEALAKPRIRIPDYGRIPGGDVLGFPVGRTYLKGIPLDSNSDSPLGSNRISANFSVKKTRAASKWISSALSEPTDYWITPRTAARCDPSTILYDGLTATQCLDRYEAFQRDEINGLPPLTDSQKEAARKLRVK